MLMIRLVAALAIVFVSAVASLANETDDSRLWAAIAEGRAVAMMRHALAPGGGDPANFDVNDCATQRNLSDEGRAQAVAIGAAFREAGITQAQVLSSQWCRCDETAKLLDIGTVSAFEPLNSFFQNRAKATPQTNALRAFLIDRTNTDPLVLVTHQVNITALTGVFPRSGEIVVFSMSATGDVDVLGSL